MKCLVLAAGYATRLYPLTKNFPKSLLKVGDKTILDHLLDDVDKTGKINEYIIISNHKYINYFNQWKNTKKLNSKITIIDDGTISNDTRLGAVKDISLAINKLKINEELMVIASDNILDFSLSDFIDYYYQKEATVVMRYFEENKEKIKKSACLLIDSDDLVLNMEEKPDNPKSNWCSPPFYIYSKDALEEVDRAISGGCKIETPGSFISYLYNKQKIYAMKMPGHRYDIGTIENYEDICQKYNNK